MWRNRIECQFNLLKEFLRVVTLYFDFCMAFFIVVLHSKKKKTNDIVRGKAMEI